MGNKTCRIAGKNFFESQGIKYFFGYDSSVVKGVPLIYAQKDGGDHVRVGNDESSKILASFCAESPNMVKAHGKGFNKLFHNYYRDLILNLNENSPETLKKLKKELKYKGLFRNYSPKSMIRYYKKTDVMLDKDIDEYANKFIARFGNIAGSEDEIKQKLKQNIKGFQRPTRLHKSLISQLRLSLFNAAYSSTTKFLFKPNSLIWNLSKEHELTHALTRESLIGDNIWTRDKNNNKYQALIEAMTEWMSSQIKGHPPRGYRSYAAVVGLCVGFAGEETAIRSFVDNTDGFKKALDGILGEGFYDEVFENMGKTFIEARANPEERMHYENKMFNTLFNSISKRAVEIDDPEKLNVFKKALTSSLNLFPLEQRRNIDYTLRIVEQRQKVLRVQTANAPADTKTQIRDLQRALPPKESVPIPNKTQEIADTKGEIDSPTTR